MQKWQPAMYHGQSGILELWFCICHNGLIFNGFCQEDAEQERAKYYNQA